MKIEVHQSAIDQYPKKVTVHIDGLTDELRRQIKKDWLERYNEDVYMGYSGFDEDHYYRESENE